MIGRTAVSRPACFARSKSPSSADAVEALARGQAPRLQIVEDHFAFQLGGQRDGGRFIGIDQRFVGRDCSEVGRSTHEQPWQRLAKFACHGRRNPNLVEDCRQQVEPADPLQRNQSSAVADDDLAHPRTSPRSSVAG